MKQNVICVDDDPNLLSALRRRLGRRYSLSFAESAGEALKRFEEEGPYAVIVADMQMPETNGVTLLTQIGERWPDTVRIMLTGNADQQTAVDAVNQGHIYRFLNKPCSSETLSQALDDGLKHHRLITAERELLENTFNGAIKVLSDILSAVDAESFGRGQVLREQMSHFLSSLEVEKNWELETAALLSQIGFVTVPIEITRKARSGKTLAASEQDMIAQAPKTGAELLANIPRLENVAKIIRYQQKDFDGGGFPKDDVAGEEIPLGARILKVLGDLCDQESRGTTRAEALATLQERRGRYDPRVLDAAFRAFDTYLKRSSLDPDEVLSLRVAQLRPGHWLLSDVITNDGFLILAAGNRITPVVLHKIVNFATVSGIKEPIDIEASSDLT